MSYVHIYTTTTIQVQAQQLHTRRNLLLFRQDVTNNIFYFEMRIMSLPSQRYVPRAAHRKDSFHQYFTPASKLPSVGHGVLSRSCEPTPHTASTRAFPSHLVPSRRQWSLRLSWDVGAARGRGSPPADPDSSGC
jgi:hypothetical protein